MFDYSKYQISAYAEAYGTHEVLRGKRLALPYKYDRDGITAVCVFCGSRLGPLIFESWIVKPIKTQGLLPALTREEAPIRPREFAYKLPVVSLCKNCGAWVAEQEIIGEELRYAIQVVGSLGVFRNPDIVPVDELVQYLALRRTRLADISPSAFERLAAEFLKFEWRPCEVVQVGYSNHHDGGVDLLLIKDNDDEYLVQVKHHPKYLKEKRLHRETVRHIRELNGVLLRENKIKGIFVTSARGYTKEGKQEVASTRKTIHGYDLILLDKHNLDRWLVGQVRNCLPWRDCMEPGLFPGNPVAWLADPAIGNAKMIDIDF